MSGEGTDRDEFDERARAAGRALREPAPEGGIARVQSAQRRRRVVRTAGACVVGVIAVGGVVAVLDRTGDDESTIVQTAPSTTGVPPSTQLVPTTTAPDTTAAPDTTEVLDPTTTVEVPDTTRAPDTTTTEVPATTDGLPPTLWLGPHLLGYLDEAGRFVGEDGTVDPPAGLAGATIDLETGAGAVDDVLVVECSNGYDLDPDRVEIGWGISYSPDFEPAFLPPDDDRGLEEMRADLRELGIDPAYALSYGNDFAADGSIDRLVAVDGWMEGAGFQAPTWIATWDQETGEFTTIEGDLDPSLALSIGTPAPPWTDVDRDGNAELAWSVGDAFLLTELSTGETLAAGAAHMCEQTPPGG